MTPREEIENLLAGIDILEQHSTGYPHSDVARIREILATHDLVPIGTVSVIQHGYDVTAKLAAQVQAENESLRAEIAASKLLRYESVRSAFAEWAQNNTELVLLESELDDVANEICNGASAMELVEKTEEAEANASHTKN